MKRKTCTRCKVRKTLKHFDKNRKGKSSHCKPCRRAAFRVWREKNRDKAVAATKKRRENNVEYTRAQARKWSRKNRDRKQTATSRWGYLKNGGRDDIAEVYSELRSALREHQSGRCGICNKPEDEIRKLTKLGLVLDHCHKTGWVRGLLCSVCNRVLGLIRDDPNFYPNSIFSKYLLRGGVRGHEKVARRFGLLADAPQ